MVRHSKGMPGDAQGRTTPSSKQTTSADQDGPETAQPGRGRTARTELTAQQLQAIALYISNPNKAAVAAEIGVSPKSVSRWFQNPAFVTEYRRQLGEVQLELWAQMVAVKNEAWDRFKKLMADVDPRISLRATTWFLDRFLSAPTFIGRSTARETGIEAQLQRRERELLELVGTLGRDEIDPEDASSGADGRYRGRVEDDPGDDNPEVSDERPRR